MAEENIAHGVNSEPLAIAAFEKKTGLTVIDINTSYSFKVGGKTFYGKIDGRVDGEEDAIVEPKCPISSRSRYMQIDEDGVFILTSSPPNPYYHQIQAYMYALDKELCYFFDWRADGRLDIAKVPRDRPFFDNVLEVLGNYNGPLHRMKDIAYICDNNYYMSNS